MTQRLEIVVRILPDGAPLRIKGRRAWALLKLVEAGAVGITTLSHPSPRLPAYVHMLRKAHGLKIETIDERHGGQFPGVHARYRLVSKILIVDNGERGAA